MQFIIITRNMVNLTQFGVVENSCCSVLSNIFYAFRSQRSRDNTCSLKKLVHIYTQQLKSIDYVKLLTRHQDHRLLTQHEH